MSYFLLGLGSNIEPENNLRKALELLQQQGEVVSASPAVTTEAVGDTFHFAFMNQLVILHSEQQPNFLKIKLQNIERALGREAKNPERKEKDRTIDIDILYRSDEMNLCLNAELEDSYNQQVQQLWLAQNNGITQN